MDFTIPAGLVFFAVLLLSAAASTLATFLLLRVCFHDRRTSAAAADAEPTDSSSQHFKTHSPLNHVKKEEHVDEVGEATRLTWPDIASLTGGFAGEVVGRGGFSTVYLARLADGTSAAVKVHRCGGGERLLRAFRLELDLLRRLRHPHIVRLLAYSDDHEEEGALVLEYLPNGTLASHLHNSERDNPLSWPSRMRILYEISGALDHLHSGSDNPIVHGDVTASNVLLDSRLGSRLCDLGSARAGFSAAVAPLDSGRLGLNRFESVVGSPGYADPYFLRTGVISKKSDVYSFGVLTLEVITGMPAVGSDGGKNLTAEILPRVRAQGVEGLVDPRLHGKYDVAEAAAAAAIAVECVGPQPSLRPSMALVREVIGEKIAASISTVDQSSGSHDFS